MPFLLCLDQDTGNTTSLTLTSYCSRPCMLLRGTVTKLSIIYKRTVKEHIVGKIPKKSDMLDAGCLRKSQTSHHCSLVMSHYKACLSFSCSLKDSLTSQRLDERTVHLFFFFFDFFFALFLLQTPRLFFRDVWEGHETLFCELI